LFFLYRDIVKIEIYTELFKISFENKVLRVVKFQISGEVSCEYVSCPELSCRTPVQLPGECCPVCQQCDYNGRSYEEGQRFTPKLEPCLDCVCQVSVTACHYTVC
jgi:hypothetical protein